ncbi:MAG: hypothetical protein ACRC51_11100 [Cetobacterium sp.]
MKKGTINRTVIILMVLVIITGIDTIFIRPNTTEIITVPMLITMVYTTLVIILNGMDKIKKYL